MLGNNYGADKAVFSEYLEDIVDRLAPRPTVLLTVTEFRPDRADVNDVIFEIAAENDNVRVVDWASETVDDPALVGGDGLHLSNEGRVRYADVVGRALGRAPGIGEGDCLGSNFTDDSAVTIPAVVQVTTPPVNNPGGGGTATTTQPAPPPPVETQPPAPPPPVDTPPPAPPPPVDTPPPAPPDPDPDPPDPDPNPEPVPTPPPPPAAPEP
jgi:hypothetical protein